MNVLVEFQKCDNLYSDLYNHVNKIENSPVEIVNGVLINYKNIRWIIGPILYTDGISIDEEKEEEINIEVYIGNIYQSYIIKKIKFLLDINLDAKNKEERKHTLFFDSHLNLFFIEFEGNFEEDLFYNLEEDNIEDLLNRNYKDTNINFRWLSINDSEENDEIYFRQYNANGIIFNNYYWNNEFKCLPPIPYLGCYITEDNSITRNGSSVIDDNNKLIGIVSYINSNIVITPLVSIIRSLKYFEGKIIKIINISTIVKQIQINGSIEYGLMIKNNYNQNLHNYYERMNNRREYEEINDNDTKIYKKYNMLSKGSIIRSVNRNKIDKDGYIRNNNISIPIKSYIWLLKIDNKYVDFEIYNNIRKKNITEIINLSKLETSFLSYKLENKNLGINIHEIKYVKYNNKYLFELNEKFIDIFQNLILNDEYVTKHLEDNRYNVKNKKILFGIDLGNESIKIKIVQKLISIDDINQNESKHSLRNYINNLLR